MGLQNTVERFQPRSSSSFFSSLEIYKCAAADIYLFCCYLWFINWCKSFL